MQSAPLDRIRGQVERVTYSNDETGYSVIKVRVRGRHDLVTVVGTLMNPMAGEILLLSGEWTTHPKFGEQFKLAFYSREVPATSAGIEKYLGSGLIKGIGPKMAHRIVARFGEKTLDIIEHKPELLTQVDGIGTRRVAQIRKAWEEQKEIRDVMVFLQSQGVSANYATKIYKQYGKESIKTVTENPYRLAYDIYGIGFITADSIAMKLGFAVDSPLRVEAGVLYALHALVEEGHVFACIHELLQSAEKLLGIQQKELLLSALERLEIDRRVKKECLVFGKQEKDAVYLSGYYYAECAVAERLTALLREKSPIRPVEQDKAIEWAEEKSGLRLAAKQREAVTTALCEKIVIITGGPGTGKSTILSVILRIYRALTKKILLAAPTGRAAKRMTEVTGMEAKTIHRLLVYDFKKGGFKKNENDQLDCDLLILDEVSMVDLLLFHHLLKAVPSKAKIIFVGDTNQLPSVGAGAVLHDMITSHVIPGVCLTEVFRQAQTSTIITTAHSIIHGRQVFFANQEQDDMFFIEEADPEAIVTTIVGLVQTRLPRKYGYHPVHDIQVLSPMNRGGMGTQRLNDMLQEALNPHAKQLVRGSRLVRLGDKVMQIRNNYEKDVFNGDIGFITKIDEEEHVITVSFDDRNIPYDYQDLDELVLAYAISIHKSQGAEYPCVVIPLSTQHFVMLQRNLLYTGITRGKKCVVLVGTRKALSIAIRNTKVLHRNSYLNLRLQLCNQECENGSSST
ncbi:MAG: ATP-dependent RecD-like DNA helicase [Desulfovibrio sp.]|nr:ATP-dependent RecD-like DNA helicase [Desulfovibrio sp.]